MDEALKFALENGIIDLSYIQDKYEMNKRQELLSLHKMAVSQGKDGYWRTYIFDSNKKRKLIKKKNKSDIENFLIDFYKKQVERPKTFNDAYKSWRRFKDEMMDDNSACKYDTDYNRYFLDEKFTYTELSKITEETIQLFIVQKVQDLKLCKKACKTLYGYIKNTIHSALVNGLIDKDPMVFLQAKQFYKYCTEIEKPITKVLVSDREMKLLYQQFYEDYQSQPEYIPTYAVHLATLTGMRVGELSALRWDCITDKYIIVKNSEKYNRKTKRYRIDTTKNKKERIFPITPEISDLLEKIKKVEMTYGYICEWVFANESGRIHAPVISSCSKNKCHQLGIDPKGIHAYRKTLNSRLRCNGASSTVAASLLGHTKEVNEQYYTFDVSTIQEKEELVSKAIKYHAVS